VRLLDTSFPLSLSRALADRARRLAALAERARARNEEDVLYALRLLVSGALVLRSCCSAGLGAL
jgi:hypothetical protein